MESVRQRQIRAQYLVLKSAGDRSRVLCGYVAVIRASKQECYEISRSWTLSRLIIQASQCSAGVSFRASPTECGGAQLSDKSNMAMFDMLILCGSAPG